MIAPGPSDDEGEDASGLMGTRAQAMQRLQVGVGGLAALVLMVGLASTIMQQARQSEDPAGTSAVLQEEKSGDPLVDIGVVPEIKKEPELPAEDVSVPDLPVERMVVEQEQPDDGPPAER